MNPRSLLPVAALCLLLPRAAIAVQPSALFTDHAVLQGGKPVPVWGKGAPGEKITVRFKDAAAQGVTGTDGTWQVRLPPLKTGDAGELVFEGASTVTSRDVLVGDVWLCSGQSNMEWLLSRSRDGDQEVAAADHPAIRHFKVRHVSLDKPTRDLQGRWMVCTPPNAGNFSAVGYFFALQVQGQGRQPIGLLDVSWGGSPIETWLSDEAIDAPPGHGVVRERWAKYVQEDYPRLKADFDRATAEQKAGGPKPPKPPKPPRQPDAPGTQKMVSGGFNGVLNPVVPYALKGILWYQGEHNTATYPAEYAGLFEALIADLRAKWGEPALPFLYVQLANYHGSASQPTHWAVLREQQEKALEVPHTAMAVAIDIGRPDETVHPLNKQEIGRRLALLALDKVYAVPTAASGPVFKEQLIEGNKVRLKFDPSGGAPVLRAPAVPGVSFQIAGKDRRLYPAEASQDGPDIILRSKDVPEPLTVRYLWMNAPAAILYNAANLPARPFRTDDWPEPPATSKKAAREVEPAEG